MSVRDRAIALVRRAGAPVGSVMRVRTEEPVVVATFDDGPSFRTATVLSALADAGATATFFVLLSRTRRDPGLLDDILGGGHELALHGPDHRRLTTLPPDSLAGRMRDARAELEDLAGRPIHWFRPPYGAQSLRSWRAVKAAGMEPVLWGPTLADWRDAPHDERLRLALSAERGAIILGHDGHADAVDGVDDGPAPTVDHATLLPEVVAGYAARGLRLTSLGTAAANGRLVREARFRS
ncbi:polysaccharide deacetylase family protein [Cryocola sp. 340MFSha3.1]|uniref:polysaccharide deacetylase family protein n=1 Tax=Cryocola sp. 340MFSha3.1 TaxID=1169145 RepID=UPI000369626D|nr:polysaccharide deacetylase family protein [Cryocola sp. 340MFSha3.1]